MRNRRGLAVLVAGLVLLTSACGSRPESPRKDAVMRELAPWSQFVTNVTLQEGVTDVVETNLSAYKDLDFGPARAMCDQLEAAKIPGMSIATVHSANGKAMATCIVEK